MEQQKNNLENPEQKLKNFKEEIRRIVEEEREGGKTAHFPEPIDVEELLPEDLEIWDKIWNETITQEEITQYRKSFLDNNGEVKEGMSVSRMRFVAFASNKAGPVIMMKGMKEKSL